MGTEVKEGSGTISSSMPAPPDGPPCWSRASYKSGLAYWLCHIHHRTNSSIPTPHGHMQNTCGCTRSWLTVWPWWSGWKRTWWLPRGQGVATAGEVRVGSRELHLLVLRVTLADWFWGHCGLRAHEQCFLTAAHGLLSIPPVHRQGGQPRKAVGPAQGGRRQRQWRRWPGAQRGGWGRGGGGRAGAGRRRRQHGPCRVQPEGQVRCWSGSLGSL